jgi:TPR repeat protein
MIAGDANAHFDLGTAAYLLGDEKLNVSQDQQKGLELLFWGGDLGLSELYYQLGTAYMSGHGVEKDKKKGRHYLSLQQLVVAY